MWPLFSEEAKDEKKLKKLSLGDLNACANELDALKENDVAFKFWIPEIVKELIDQFSDLQGDTVSARIRNLLIVHCYGLHAYSIILEKEKRRNAADLFDIPMFSRKSTVEESDPTYWVAKLGKNIAPIKLWIPVKLKTDIAKLAEIAGITSSNYVREIVIARYLGHGMIPNRLNFFDIEPTSDLERWCNDEEITMYEVDENEYLKYPIGQVTYDSNPNHSDLQDIEKLNRYLEKLKIK